MTRDVVALRERCSKELQERADMNHEAQAQLGCNQGCVVCVQFTLAVPLTTHGSTPHLQPGTALTALNGKDQVQL